MNINKEKEQSLPLALGNAKEKGALWQTATNNIQPLRQQVELYLTYINREHWTKGEDPYMLFIR